MSNAQQEATTRTCQRIIDGWLTEDSPYKPGFDGILCTYGVPQDTECCFFGPSLKDFVRNTTDSITTLLSSDSGVFLDDDVTLMGPKRAQSLQNLHDLAAISKRGEVDSSGYLRCHGTVNRYSFKENAIAMMKEFADYYNLKLDFSRC